MRKSEMRDELALLITRQEELIKEQNVVLDALKVILTELHNRPRVMRGKSTSKKMTPELTGLIVRAHEISPYTSQHELAKRFGVNPGRISEALAGKRT